jgi:hypothetical protein
LFARLVSRLLVARCMSQRCLASLSSFSVTLLSTLLGCGDSIPGAPLDPDAADERDAPDLVPDAPAGFAITVGTRLPPALIAVREGTGPWRTPAVTGPADFTFDVTGPYTLFVVCVDADGGETIAHQLGRTPDDARDVKVACTKSPAHDARLEGSMVQPGRVYVWNATEIGKTENWDYVVPRMPEGVFDLFAIGEGRIAVRRDVVVAGTTIAAPLDVSAGTELVPVPFTISNPGPGTTDVGLVVSTSSTRAPLPLSGGVPLAAPTSFLTQGMEQHARGYTFDNGSYRTARVPFRIGDSTAITLMDPIGDARIALDAATYSASWTTLNALDELRLGIDGAPASGVNGQNRHEVVLSKRFIDATHATRVVFATDIPGLDAEWLPSPKWPSFTDVVELRRESGAEYTAESHALLDGEALRRSLRR